MLKKLFPPFSTLNQLVSNAQLVYTCTTVTVDSAAAIKPQSKINIILNSMVNWMFFAVQLLIRSKCFTAFKFLGGADSQTIKLSTFPLLMSG